MAQAPASIFETPMPYLFNGILSDMDRLLGDRRRADAEGFSLDVEETEDAYILTANVPGVKSDEIELSMEREVLTLSVRQKPKSEENGRKSRYALRERRLIGGTRSVSLPFAAPSDEVDANLTDGVLTVTIRKDAAKKTRKIAIRESN